MFVSNCSFDWIDSARFSFISYLVTTAFQFGFFNYNTIVTKFSNLVGNICAAAKEVSATTAGDLVTLQESAPMFPSVTTVAFQGIYLSILPNIITKFLLFVWLLVMFLKLSLQAHCC